MTGLLRFLLDLALFPVAWFLGMAGGVLVAAGYFLVAVSFWTALSFLFRYARRYPIKGSALLIAFCLLACAIFFAVGPFWLLVIGSLGVIPLGLLVVRRERRKQKHRAEPV